jgi:hypothetical protein
MLNLFQHLTCRVTYCTLFTLHVRSRNKFGMTYFFADYIPNVLRLNASSEPDAAKSSKARSVTLMI